MPFETHSVMIRFNRCFCYIELRDTTVRVLFHSAIVSSTEEAMCFFRQPTRDSRQKAMMTWNGSHTLKLTHTHRHTLTLTRTHTQAHQTYLSSCEILCRTNKYIEAVQLEASSPYLGGPRQAPSRRRVWCSCGFNSCSSSYCNSAATSSYPFQASRSPLLFSLCGTSCFCSGSIQSATLSGAWVS